MKKILFGLIMVLGTGGIAANAQTAAAATLNKAVATIPPAPAPVISFTADKYEFGNVPQGTPVTHVFSFKNTGAVPLVLSSVTAQCGCTTPEWPKEAIAPNATAKITVTYNAATPGPFTKTVTVVSNAAVPQTILTIQGEVKPAATANQATAPKAAPVQIAAPKKS